MTKSVQMDRRNMSQVGQCCPACSKNGKSHFLIPKNILRCENNECFYVTEANVHVSNTVNLPGAVASRDDQSINNHTKYVLLNSNHKLNPNNLLTPLKEIQDDFKPNMDIKLIPNNYFNEQYFNFKDQYDSEINIAAHALKNEIFFVNACISQAGDICPKCYREGRTNKLCIFYIETNFAILRCEDINCLYPLFAEAAIKNQNDKSLNAMNSNNNAEYPKIKKFQLKTCSEVSLVSKIMKSKRNFIFPANNNFSSALPLDKEGKRVVKFSITVRASVSGIFSNGKTNINMETEDLKTNDAHAKYLNNLRMSVIGDKLEITQKNLNEDSRVFPTSNHENNVNFMESNLVPNSLKLTRTAKSSLLSPKSCSVYTNTSSENQVVDSRQISKTNNIKSFNSNSSSVISGINHNCNKNKEIKANLNISNERPVFSISNINSNYDTVTRTANDFSKSTNQSTHKAKHLKRSREESESEISNKKYKKDVRHNFHGSNAIKANPNIHEPSVFSVSNINPNYESVSRTVNEFTELICQWIKTANHLKGSPTKSEGDISGGENEIRMMESLSLPVISDKSHDFNGIYETRFSVSNENTDDPVVVKASSYSESIDQRRKPVAHSKRPFKKRRSQSVCGENEIRKMKSSNLPDLFDNNYGFKGRDEIAVQLKTCDAQQRVSVSSKKTDPMATKPNGYSESIDQQMKPSTHSKWSRTKSKSDTSGEENGIRMTESLSLPIISDESHDFNEIYETRLQSKIRDNHPGFSTSNENSDDPVVRKATTYSKSIDQRRNPVAHSKRPIKKPRSQSLCGEYEIRKMKSPSRGLPDLSDNNYEFNGINETAVQLKTCDEQQRFSVSNKNTDDLVAIKASGYTESIDQQMKPSTHSKWSHTKSKSDTSGEENGIRMMESLSLPVISDESHDFKKIYETRFSVSSENPDDPVAINASGYSESIDQRKKPSTHSKWSHTKSKSDTSGEENGIRMVESLSLPVISDESHDFKEMYETRFSVSSKNPDDPAAINASGYSESIDQQMKPSTHSKWPHTNSKSPPFCVEEEICNLKSPGLPDLFDVSYDFNGIYETTVQPEICNKHPEFSVSNKNTDYESVTRNVNGFSESINQCTKTATFAKSFRRESEDHASGGENEICKVKPCNLSVDSHRKKEIGVQLQVCDEHLAFPISNINFNYESVKKNANVISIFDPIEEQTQTTEHIERFSDISSMLSDASQVITIKENIVNRTEIFDTHPHSFSFNKSYQSANQTIPDLGETFSVSVNKNLNTQSTNTGMSGSSDHTYFKDRNKIKRARETKIVQSKACGELQGSTISTIKKPNAESLTTKDISANDNHFGHHSSYGNIKIDMPSFDPQISDGTLANNISGTNNISVTSNISGTNNISRTNNISGTNNIITDTKPVAKTQQRKKRKKKIKLSKDPVEVIPLVYNKKIHSATNKLVESPMSDSKKLSNLTAGKSETFSNKAYAAKCDMSYKLLNEPIANSPNNNRKAITNTETEEGSSFKIPNVFGPLKIRTIKNEEISKQSNNIENIKNTKKGSNESLTNSTSEDSKTDFEQIIDISDDFDIMKIINEQSTDKMSDSMYDDFLNVLSTEFYTSDETIKNDQSKSADIKTADSNEVQIMEETFDTISFENMDNIMKHNENNNITVIVPQDQILKSDQVTNEDIKISVSYDINEHMSYSINFADLNNTISTNAENSNSKNDTLNEQFDINKLDIISNIQLIEPTTEQSLENTITVLKTETLENNSNKSEGLAIYMSKVVDNETVYSRKGRKRSRLSGSTPSIPQPNDDLKLETLKNIVSTKKKTFQKKAMKRGT